MKTRIQVALTCTLLSIIAHLYLTFHYYPLKFGFAAGQSICNLNAKFDCDAVSASMYSAVFGIPLAVWGVVFNSILFLLILLSWLEWTDYPERLRRFTLGLAGLSLGTSLVMGMVSVLLVSNYCLFCIAAYVFSAIIFFAYRGVLREPFWQGLKNDLPTYRTQSMSLLIALVAIPAGAFLMHQIFMQNLGEAEIGRMVKESVIDWEQSTKYEFVAKPSLIKGPNDAVLTLVEFADFRCSHCKRASYTLDAFVKAHPDVRFEYYSFPLDGACNEKMESSSGLSCRLAASVHCAEKESKGWEMHHLLFDQQDEINGITNVAALDIHLSKNVTPLGINWDSMQRCLDQPETMDAIRAQAKQGVLVNVNATPTLFANGRVLSRGQLVPVLQAVHQRAKQLKGN